jgi:hypothetical protein
LGSAAIIGPLSSAQAVVDRPARKGVIRLPGGRRREDVNLGSIAARIGTASVLLVAARDYPP